MFGGCVNVAGEPNTGLSFNGKPLTAIGKEEYSFEYVDSVDYGIANDHDIHVIRRKGIFKFSYNHLIVDYSVGEVGAVESQYRFNGWR
ncbi:hypothetical protein GCM10023092_18450 [Rurimicrobium arvi]|uniref:Uncharacterized protein n=1 Tax=Rurimicrobium arvi TaxID=2049916 RepID=A0ABP8MSH4_9BACT